jgi:uncharacterized protein (TIGR00159 family)
MEHQNWLTALWHSFRAFGIADLLDIAVVSAFIYSILLWFEWTKAAFVARGILILGALYILARQMGMVLTTWIFHGFFAVFVIALVIIFQEEIRRFFERLALWNFRRGRKQPLLSDTAEILLETVSSYAQSKTGALIVLRGRDPLERHIEGGIELDGRVSGVLLQSIFNIHADGHDGAVIIEDDRVRRFGAHLPLSKNLEKLSGVGTRHAAALGVSELTDALCIVVSEQRGTISVAQNGTLRRMDNLHDLGAALTQFLARDQRVTKSPGLVGVLRHNFSEKLLAFGLSVVLWLVFVQGFKPETRTYTVSVQVQNVSNGLRVKGVSPRRVAVTVSGLKRDLDLISANRVKTVISVEGREAGPERFLISEDNVQLPDVVRFVSCDPPAVEVDFARTFREPAANNPASRGPLIPQTKPDTTAPKRNERL